MMDEFIVIDLRNTTRDQIEHMKQLLHSNGYSWIVSSILEGNLLDSGTDSIDIRTKTKKVTRARLTYYQDNYPSWPVKTFEEAKYLFNNK